MSTCGRYAPSPSGPLHLGNLRTALLAWMQARLANGRFILRMEDLDRPRTQPGAAAQIIADLRWLGIEWDEGPDCGGPSQTYNQSQRDAHYREAFDHLQQRGLLFACHCSRKDIAAAASAPHGAHPLYPGTCRTRQAPSTDAMPPGNAMPPRNAIPPRNAMPLAWRYRTPARTIEYTDMVAGPQRQSLSHCAGDFVVRRKDGLFAYQLAVVVDDALMGVTDVVRGADLLDSTPLQLELLHTLGHQAPRHWHVPMMRDAHGQRLAKRADSTSPHELRIIGMGQAQTIGLLAASLGLVDRGRTLSAAELLQEFDLTKFRTALQASAAREKNIDANRDAL